jgi:hypothetical protein
MNNHFIRPFVPDQTQMTREANDVNAMLLRRGIVTTIYCDTEYSYTNGVAAVWNSKCRNLWIIEHDIIPTVGIIEELEACPYPVCAPLYYTNPMHSGLADYIIPHRFFTTEGELTWISAGMEWADKIGLGCVKFDKLVRDPIDSNFLLNKSWRTFDNRLSDIFIEFELKFHIHNIWAEHKQK